MSGRMTEANLEQYKPTVFEQIITLRESLPAEVWSEAHRRVAVKVFATKLEKTK